MTDLLKKLIDYIRNALGIDSPKPKPKPPPKPKPKPKPKPSLPKPTPKPKPVPTDKLTFRKGGLFIGNSPYVIVGAGDPEDFLYLPKSKQRRIVNKCVKYRIPLVAYLTMTHGGDAAWQDRDDMNPYRKHNPKLGLDPKKLNYFNLLFQRLDSAGAAIILNLYDDEAQPYSKNKNVITAQEKKYIEGIVTRFSHLRHLIYMIAEEFQEIMTHSKVVRVARIIRKIDPHHPIGVHQIHSPNFNFPRAGNLINMFFMQYNNADKHTVKRIMTKAVKDARGRYGVCLFESTQPGLNVYGTGKTALDKDRACVSAGGHVMRYQRGQWDFPDSDLKSMQQLARSAEAKLSRG